MNPCPNWRTVGSGRRDAPCRALGERSRLLGGASHSPAPGAHSDSAPRAAMFQSSQVTGPVWTCEAGGGADDGRRPLLLANGGKMQIKRHICLGHVTPPLGTSRSSEAGRQELGYSADEHSF